MSTTACARCGKPDAEHYVRFALVGREEDKSHSTRKQGLDTVETTTTTTKEQLIGVESACFCDACIQKQRRAIAIGWGVGSFFVALIAGYLVGLLLLNMIFGGKSGGDNDRLFMLISLGLGLIVGVLCGRVFYSAMMEHETPRVAAKLYEKLPGVKKASEYVPLSPEIYCMAGQTTPDISVFKTKTNLKTNLADAIFIQYIKGPVFAPDKTE